MAAILAPLLLMAGCHDKLVALGDIPIYPGAAPLERGQHQLIDALMSEIESKKGAQGQAKMYTLPGSAAWDSIRDFYHDKLISAGWALEPTLTLDETKGAFVVSGISWFRGNGPGRQVAQVFYIFDGRFNSAFMGILLSSKS